MASEEEQLKQIRDEIDALDQQIQALVSRRAQYATEVASIKRSYRPDQSDFYRPEREAEVLRKVKARNEGPLDDETMLRLFRQIMSDCLALQQS